MSLPELIDTHAHLNDEQFQGQIESLLHRAEAAGVRRIIAIGTTAESSRQCVQIAQQYGQVWAAVGIQPNYCSEARDGDWEQIVELAQADRVVAIGETGLDWYWAYAPLELQRDYFQRHLQLSQATGLPFIVHMREPDEPQLASRDEPKSCCDDIYQMVAAASRHGDIRGVMHSYTGSAEMTKAFCALGMYVSFAGMATYRKSAELRAVAAGLSSDRILVETDAPYLSPEPVRGQRPNEPSCLVHTARCLAAARGESFEDFAMTTTRNALRLFWKG